ncbi:class III poly(R)-hydroxyalkanoic acid synthase subunit PhaE [Luteimonas saliphila]|uniref:class III poly(R)-hydroxyalkanoic acid synthase subunit PhaE n=1 Tax=Luteimonas saliphila TaxID=2804919 RepID=UPI00192E1368|nr:class III poly(R)-hydroxyalkanoic acid synthase subunit PhaE [Luteimonas saliphila]
MANGGFGFGAGPASTDEFERLARQYWGAWGDALRSAAPGSGQSGAHAWQDAIDWWTRYAHGGRSGMNDALERFNVQARDWYGRMQQVAAQFAGRDSSARDVAAAWKQALGASGMNPFPEMFRSMRGQGMRGLDQWVEDASPWLDAMRGEGMFWLRLPAFGAGREQQERLQQLAQALAEYDESNSAYGALMLKASQLAFERFEDRLVEHEEPGRQIESPRALFDLWIDSAEEAYAEIALSPEFREVYARLVDAQMRVRGGVQRQVEQASAMLGMPTRTEIDAAHRKIVDLERTLRRLRDAIEGSSATRPGDDGRPAAAAQTARPAKTATKGRKAGAGARPAAQSAAPQGASRASATKAGRKRVARKLAPRPTVTARRAPTNGFSSAIPMPVAPEPLDRGPASKRGGR